jgi:hypothetical protein
MKRVAIATAWVWVALAQPASAHARASLRGGGPEMCAITPSLAANNVARDLAPQAPPDDSPIAWCSTPDDPRCSSRDASSLPGSGHGQVPLNSACGVTPPAPHVREVARVSRASQLGAARDGQALRIERPPRASLRRG